MYLVLRILIAGILLCRLKSLVNCSHTHIFYVVTGEVEETAMLADQSTRIVYSRHQLLSYRRSAGVLILKSTYVNTLAECGLLRYRGTRGGLATRAWRAARLKPKLPYYVNRRVEKPGVIPTVIGRRSAVARWRPASRTAPTVTGNSSLLYIRPLRPATTDQVSPTPTTTVHAPSLYVLNSAALSKPHAIEQLAADLSSYNSDVAVISETHFKTKHSDSVVSIPGYMVLRRDRNGRRGGGVAVYARSSLQPAVVRFAEDDPKFEVLWVRIGSMFFGAVYHPPRPLYRAESLVDYFEACVAELQRDFPSSLVVLAGDFNQLSDSDITERTGFVQLVNRPTRGASILDRIYASYPHYSAVHVVQSTVRSDHKAIVAFAERQPILCKARAIITYRCITPTHHALFLQFVSSTEIFNFDQSPNTQAAFDHFYDTAISLLNLFYPEREVTVTSRDPDWITPSIKAKLRRKNRLMRSGRVEEASALATRIGKDITKRNKARLTRVDSRINAKSVWAAVRQLTGKKQEPLAVDGVDAHTLNQHYARISTDKQYSPPLPKLTVPYYHQELISEWRMF